MFNHENLKGRVAVVTGGGGVLCGGFAKDLAKLGVPVVLSCKVGKDSFGDFVKNTAAANGVDVKGVVSGDVDTTVSIVCVSSKGERSFLYNPGSAADFKLSDIPDELIDECDIVFVAGAMLLSSFDGAPCAELMRRAREKGKYTVMDTAWDFDDVWLPKIREVIPHLDLFMPSIDEAAKLVGLPADNANAIADKLFELGADNVIVKVGKDGALICTGQYLQLVAMGFSALAMAVFTHFAEKKKMAWLDNFSIAGSMLAAMAVAVVIG